MRRSVLVSAVTAVVVAALMMSKFKTEAGAQGAKPWACLNGCGKDEAPPKCCTTPPCEIFQGLAKAVAWSRSLQRGAAGSKRQINEYFKIVENIAKCPGTDRLPVLIVDSQCKIVGNANGRLGELSLGEALAANSTVCPERIQARYESALVEQAFCQANPNITELGYQRAAAAEAKFLNNSINRFYGSCLPFLGQMDYNIMGAWLDALVPPMPSKPPPPKAKRAAGPGRGR